MNKLFIVRHGIAYPQGSSGYTEEDRPLTDRGIRRMRRIGRGLHRIGVKPEKIYSSPIARARQTAEIVGSALRCSELVQYVDELRVERRAGEILEWLWRQEGQSLMIVGHNPSLEELCTLLLTGQEGVKLHVGELRKGGVVAFRAQEGGPLELEWWASPRLLRRLGD